MNAAAATAASSSSYSALLSNPNNRSLHRNSSSSCTDIRNITFVTCHSDSNKSTSQASLFLCPGSTNRRNGMLAGPFSGNLSGRKNLVCQTNYSVNTSTFDGTALESPSRVVEEKVGVLLLNLGGPETLHDVQPFLFNLFADPDIIRLPRLFRFLQRPLAKLISTLRAPKSKEAYASIGGGSPLRKITNDQALAIKKALEAKGLSSSVYVGMRYWYPFTEDAVQQIKRDGITRLVVLPLYPQFSISTTGSSIRVLQHMFREDAYLSQLPISIINSWYQREGYVKSMADLIEKELQTFSEPKEAMIFFSAHGVPVSYVENAGDPYQVQMEECIFLIMQELKARGISNEHTLAYQSRVGPVQWLKPYTDEVLVELGKKGVKSLLAVPVSFVSEHIETLEEIDMEYKELALESGVKNWARVPALGLTPSFITDLADAVIEALPSATAMYAPSSTNEDVEQDPVRFFVKMFFGSIFAFFLLLSPKMINAFKNHVI
ncbi:ferrochelatase-1, chloroplastic/mitochondrial-like [Lotus japonicus]|uniref:ferrochelatase-1, chloroplastic/mitochondrial-like n=1 Tax=Lotus japonicus TaxID=34305 RepID=UPI00258AEEBF|nr:ferrochelatase-1, chloroplastic/mitochondrial-like [Lotus japonicus]